VLQAHDKIVLSAAPLAVPCHRALRRRRTAPAAVATLVAGLVLLGCSHEPAPAPASARPQAPSVADAGPPAPAPDLPRAPEAPPTAYRARLSASAELYLPPSFHAKNGAYDLLVHFHGLGKLQEANIERAGLNVGVVSVNLGAGTDPYARGFRDPAAFERLLADVEAEIGKSGRAAHAQLGRLALSAWSAGFSSIARVLTDAMAKRVDAILLADGFFTSFSQPRKRTVNADGLQKFARFADLAKRDEKLFAITHTTIPTGPYPSVQECVAKLLEMTATKKTPSSASGPRQLREIYAVDRGSFHVHGYRGTLAADHVKQLHAMGETVYPYLKARWDKQDAEAAPASAAPATASAVSPAPASAAPASASAVSPAPASAAPASASPASAAPAVARAGPPTR
jgi:hypothetical protein